ncbi:hypothetical protein QUA41_28055 [Microcoleus sp. Pol11C1]
MISRQNGDNSPEPLELCKFSRADDRRNLSQGEFFGVDRTTQISLDGCGHGR